MGIYTEWRHIETLRIAAIVYTDAVLHPTDYTLCIHPPESGRQAVPVGSEHLVGNTRTEHIPLPYVAFTGRSVRGMVFKNLWRYVTEVLVSKGEKQGLAGRSSSCLAIHEQLNGMPVAPGLDTWVGLVLRPKESSSHVGSPDTVLTCEPLAIGIDLAGGKFGRGILLGGGYDVEVEGSTV